MSDFTEGGGKTTWLVRIATNEDWITTMKPRKHTQRPYKEQTVQCNWCPHVKPMKGKSYPDHCRNANHEYMSFTMVGQPSLFTMFQQPTTNPTPPEPAFLDDPAFFLKEKKDLHAKEDPAFLDDLSDIFDIRLRNIVEFSPEANSEGDERFEKELDSMKRKLLAETSKKFYEDQIYGKRKSSKSLSNAFGLCTMKQRILSLLQLPRKKIIFYNSGLSSEIMSFCWTKRFRPWCFDLLEGLRSPQMVKPGVSARIPRTTCSKLNSAPPWRMRWYVLVCECRLMVRL